ncbi:MAG: hypothetical protein JWM31_506 [Solirubrobacterales bacterium]|nr:hypothetical protein [Solirubrobacterales bacterium]
MRRLLLLLPALLLTLVCAGPAHAKPVLGIADQKASTFDDPRLDALHLKYARYYLSWDVLSDKHSLREADAWFAGAKKDGMQPVVTIARSRIPSKIRQKPTPAKLVAELKKWRKRWGSSTIKTISTWNEANVANHPEYYASLWVALRKGCTGCTVLGADLLDDPQVLDWTTKFVAYTKKHGGKQPTVWGLHAYNDANTFKTTITKALLKGLKGDIWITETGGVASRPRPGYTFAGCGAAFQAKATSYLLNTIAKLSPRIKRIYIFNWGLGSNDASFDSALIDAENRERPALNVIRKYLGQAQVTNPLFGVSPGPKPCKYKGSKNAKAPAAPKKKKS